MTNRIAVLCFAVTSVHLAVAQVNVITYHNDPARTGQNLSETILTTANVNRSTFGKQFIQHVDGAIYAQPLYMSRVVIGGKAHSVVFVATEHDSVYAFDADDKKGANANPLWHVSFINPPAVTTVDSSNDAGCGDLVPEIGITGTPVIDPNTRTLYVVANTKESGVFFQRLHALDIASGAEKFGGPVAIQATVPGTGDGSVGGQVSFDPLKENQRPGLLLRSGLVYVTWASHCDIGPYHGWVMAYNASSLVQEAVWNASPNGGLAGIWQGGAAPASDSSGIFFATGNGSFDRNKGGKDDGDSVIRMGEPVNGKLIVHSYFTPMNQASLSDGDVDLGAGGVVLLPALPAGSAHTLLLAQVGKEGTIYLVDREKMGGFHANSNNVVQELDGAIGGMWGMPAYWNGNVYFGGSSDNLKAYSFNAGGSGLLSAAPTSYSPQNFPNYGPTPSISANGTSNAIVWAIESGAYTSNGAAVLHAYDATNLATELYNSTQNAADNPGPAIKFTVPTIANGKVYVGTVGQLAVFGLLKPAAAPPNFDPPGGIYTAGQSIKLATSTSGANIYYTTDGTTPTPRSALYAGPVDITATGTLKAIAVDSGVRNSPVSTALYTIQTAPGNGPQYLNGFTSSALTLNGSAVLNGTALQLTDVNGGEAGSAFYNTAVNAQTFTSDFTFQITDPNADGLTFCIQNQGVTALGSSGGGLGYATDGGNGGPVITPSVAVKFDLYNNAGEGTNSTGVYTNGAPPTVPSTDLTPSGINLHSGHVLRARLQYSGTNLLLEVIDTTDSTKAFATTFAIDIPSTVGADTAFVGFTGGTGGLTAIQDILTWDYISF